MVGLSIVDVNPDGPLHTNEIPEDTPVSVTVLPGHAGPLFDADTVTGHGDHLKIVPDVGAELCAAVHPPGVAVAKPGKFTV